MIKELKLLREAFLAVAEPITSCQPSAYKELRDKGELPSPLWMHCGAVATTIRAILGGDIVTGRVKGTVHFWNRLPDGSEIDLTSCQFGGDGFKPLKKGRKVPKKEGELTNPKFLLFAERVRLYLMKPSFTPSDSVVQSKQPPPSDSGSPVHS